VSFFNPLYWMLSNIFSPKIVFEFIFVENIAAKAEMYLASRIDVTDDSYLFILLFTLISNRNVTLYP
jgi:hypothetical protein